MTMTPALPKSSETEEMLCSASGCNSPIGITKARLCRPCYGRQWREQNPDRLQVYAERYGWCRDIQKRWTPEEEKQLGTNYDHVIAQRIGRTTVAVRGRRVRRGIRAYRETKDRAEFVTKEGYVEVHCSADDPHRVMAHSKSGKVRQHRIVMADHLGRPLRSDEFVHHKNGNRADNRIENLELWSRSHPDGQRVIDKLQWAVEFIKRYAQQTVA